MMWQKLNALDILHLEKARIQLLNAVQLVSAVPRSFMEDSVACFPKWDQQSSQFYCNITTESEGLLIALDIKDLVITLSGDSRHAEHLVLSGITYPMAFGWMQIKLDSFALKGGQFNDAASYKLEKTMDANEELVVFDQQIFDDIAIYYSNAAFLLRQVNETLAKRALLRIDPADINMVLLPESRESYLIPGFSIGSKFYPEPHFFIQLTTTDQVVIDDFDAKGYLWRNKDWLGLVLPAVDFLSHDEDEEFHKVFDFFVKGLQQ